eukprot:PITA_27449
MANCMLQSKGLSLNFWLEAINCANYIVNCTPTKVLKNITPKEAWSSIKPDVSHFCVFGSETWAHIPYEKHKALEPKSEKCIFVGYSEDVKGYRLNPLKSENVIIRRDVKFAENIPAYEPSSTDVPPLSIPSTSKNIYSSDDDSEDDNSPQPSQDPPSAPQLPKWVHATRDAAGALAGDPIDQRRTHSQFNRAPSLLAQASVNYDPDTFAKASGHPDWDAAMNEEYHSLLANDTWDLVPLPKGQKLKSTAGYVFTLGFGPITWASKKQSAISLSSAEIEYHGSIEASKEALWLRQILSEFGFQQQHPSTLWFDNQSAIQPGKDPVQHQRNKHIELRMHFIRKLIHDHVLEVQYCSTDDQVVDIFTKALIEAKFTKLRFMVGVQEVVTKGG